MKAKHTPRNEYEQELRDRFAVSALAGAAASEVSSPKLAYWAYEAADEALGVRHAMHDAEEEARCERDNLPS